MLLVDLSMGSGAGVLKGDPIGVEAHGGEYGYTFTFPPDHPIWAEGHSTASQNTRVPTETGSSSEEVSEC